MFVVHLNNLHPTTSSPSSSLLTFQPATACLRLKLSDSFAGKCLCCCSFHCINGMCVYPPFTHTHTQGDMLPLFPIVLLIFVENWILMLEDTSAAKRERERPHTHTHTQKRQKKIITSECVSWCGKLWKCSSAPSMYRIVHSDHLWTKRVSF